MRFVYRLEPDDMRAVVEASGLRRRFGQPGPYLWYGLGILNLAIAGFWLATGGVGLALSHGYVLAFAAFAFSAPSLYRGYMRLTIRRHPAYGHDVVTEFTDSEIVGTYGGTVERFAYTAIGTIDDRPDHLLFWIAKRRAVVLPKRALAGVASVSAVRDHVEKGRAAMSVEDKGAHAQDTQASLVRMPWVRRGADEPVFEKTVTPVFADQMAVDSPHGRVVGAVTVMGATTLAALALAAYLAYPAWQEGDSGTVALYAASALVGGLVLGWLFAVALRWFLTALFSLALRNEGAIDAPVRLRFDRRGVETDRGGVVMQIPWTSILDIERDDRRWFFWTTVMQAVTIRLDAFESEAERENFQNWLTTWYGRPPRTPPRMARERTLPPGGEMRASDRDADPRPVKDPE